MAPVPAPVPVPQNNFGSTSSGSATLLLCEFSQCWNGQREYHSQFLLFHLRWIRSRTFSTGSGSATLMQRTDYAPRSTYLLMILFVSSTLDPRTGSPPAWNACPRWVSPSPAVAAGVAAQFPHRLVPANPCRHPPGPARWLPPSPVPVTARKLPPGPGRRVVLRPHDPPGPRCPGRAALTARHHSGRPPPALFWTVDSQVVISIFELQIWKNDKSVPRLYNLLFVTGTHMPVPVRNKLLWEGLCRVQKKCICQHSCDLEWFIPDSSTIFLYKVPDSTPVIWSKFGNCKKK